MKRISLGLGLVLGGLWAGVGLADALAARAAFSKTTSQATKARIGGEAESDRPPQTGNCRLFRFASLMDKAAQGGRVSLAKAWRQAAGDDAERHWLAELWLKQNPGEFLGMLISETEAARQDVVYGDISGMIERFAAAVPETALKMGENSSNSLSRHLLLSPAILKIMETDPKRGLAYLADHPWVRVGGSGMDRLHYKPSPEDIPILLALSPSEFQERFLPEAMKNIPVADAMKLARRIPAIAWDDCQNILGNRWAKEDPEGAWLYASTEAKGTERLNILQTLAHDKMAVNPAGAAAWIEQNLSGVMRNQLLKQAADKLVETDKTAAAAIRAKLPQDYTPKEK